MTKSPITIDFHCDYLFKKQFAFMSLLSGTSSSYHVSPDLLREGGIKIQTMALFIPPLVEQSSLHLTLKMIGQAYKMDDFKIIESINDIESIQDTDKLGMILSIEGALVLERNVDFLPVMYKLGVRAIGLTWSRSNLFADGSKFRRAELPSTGLTYDGKQLIEEMERLGMIVDVSHLDRKSFNDVAKIMDGPFIASHSNAFEICNSPRNLKDEELEALASADGVTGMNFCPSFVNQDKDKASLDDIITHINYIVKKIGIDHVGLGSDFDGITGTPIGLEDASKFKNIPISLEKEGYSKKDIDKIMGENFLRVIKKVWKK